MWFKNRPSSSKGPPSNYDLVSKKKEIVPQFCRWTGKHMSNSLVFVDWILYGVKWISDRTENLWFVITVGDTATHKGFIAVRPFVGDARSNTMQSRIALAARCSRIAALGIDGDRFMGIPKFMYLSGQKVMAVANQFSHGMLVGCVDVNSLIEPYLCEGSVLGIPGDCDKVSSPGNCFRATVLVSDRELLSSVLRLPHLVAISYRWSDEWVLIVS